MTRLDADCLEAGGYKVPVQPFRKRTGFQAHHVNLIVPKPELFNEWTGFAINLALPDELTVMIEHADSGFLQRDVEANNLAHGPLRSRGGRLRAWRGKRLATDYPISRTLPRRPADEAG